jgi:hypothetical protein
MKAILIFVLAVMLIGAGLKMAGMRLPLIDYPIGPIGVESGPDMGEVEVHAPGFDDFPAP